MATLPITQNFADSPGVTIQDLDAVAVTLVDASNDFFNNGDVQLALYSTAVGAITATIIGQIDPLGNVAADIVATIPIGSTTPQVALFSLLNPASYNSGGKVSFTVSSATNVKYALLRLSKVR